MIFFMLLFVGLTIVNIINPAIGWYLRYGWMVKGQSEPSEAYMTMSRIGSVFVLIIFLIFAFAGAWPV